MSAEPRVPKIAVTITFPQVFLGYLEREKFELNNESIESAWAFSDDKGDGQLRIMLRIDPDKFAKLLNGCCGEGA